VTPDALPWTALGEPADDLPRIVIGAATRRDRWCWLATIDDGTDRGIASGGTWTTEAEALADGEAWLAAARGAHGGDCDGGGE